MLIEYVYSGTAMVGGRLAFGKRVGVYVGYKTSLLEKEGVDLIIGGHPHVVQPMELRKNAYSNKNVLVAYSLGNFISAMRTADTRGGVMLRVVVGRCKGEPYVKGADYKLVFVNPPSSQNDNFQIVTDKERVLLNQSAKRLFDSFMERAENVFRKYNVGISEEVDILVPEMGETVAE